MTNGHSGEVEIRDGSEWFRLSLFLSSFNYNHIWWLILVHAKRKTRNLGNFSWSCRVTKFLKNIFSEGWKQKVSLTDQIRISHLTKNPGLCQLTLINELQRFNSNPQDTAGTKPWWTSHYHLSHGLTYSTPNWFQLFPSWIGGPKAAIRLSDLLEGLTRLRKAVIHMIQFIITKACRWKSAQGKGTCVKSKRNPAPASSCALLVELHGAHSILSAMTFDNMCGEFQPESLGFNWGSVM